MGADFLQLYAQLGVSADCSLDEFKHACRRRIGDLHPDRSEATRLDDRPQMPLDELLSLYTSAIHFHQKHGRLPGASHAVGATHGAGASHGGASHGGALHVGGAQARGAWHGGRMHVPLVPRPPAQAPERAPAVNGPATRDRPPTSHRYPMLILLASVALLVGIAWSRSQEAAAPTDDAGAVAAPAVAGVPAQRLELGIDRVAVAEIQGEPLRVDGSRWEYGPSWLRFEDEGLVDWYSSPLHPLKTATPTPPQD